MRPRILLAAMLIAAPLLAWDANAMPPTAPAARLIATAGLLHDRPGSDTATCTATAPGATSCNTGDSSCVYDQTQEPWEVRCTTGFHSTYGETGPFDHGVPQGCCSSYAGRITSEVRYDGGMSHVHCDIRSFNITVIRNCVGPIGGPPPPDARPGSLVHTCKSTNYVSNAGTGTGTFQCFITHP